MPAGKGYAGSSGKKHYPKNTKKPSSKISWPHEIGAAGDRFMPSTFGTHRGSEKGWAGKLPSPSKKGND